MGSKKLSVSIVVAASCLPAAAERESVTALSGGIVIDGTGAPARAATVLIRGNRIDAVGSRVAVPKQATMIDVTGKRILPGLVDMHGHMYARATATMRTQLEAYPKLYLAGGVTSVRSPGDFEPARMVELRERIKRHEVIGPRVFTAGPYFDQQPSLVNWIEGTRTPDEAAQLFEEWKGQIDCVKFYTRISEAQLAAVVKAARAAGLPTTGHLSSVTATRAIDVGIDGLEHGLFSATELFPAASEIDPVCGTAAADLDSETARLLVAKIVERRVAIDPTIVTFQSQLPEFAAVATDWSRYLSDEAHAHQTRVGLALAAARPARADCLRQAIRKQFQFVRKVHDAGGLIVAGTDPVSPRLVPGYALHRELQNLVDAGLTPLQAIRAGTLNAAIALRRERDLGTVAAGKLADLVVVGGDAENDLRALSKIEIVFQDGVRHDPDSLKQASLKQIQ